MFIFPSHSENALKAKASVKKFKGRLITIELAKRKQENKQTEDTQTEDKQTTDNTESADDGEETDEDDYELHTSQQQQQQKQRKSKSSEFELLMAGRLYLFVSRTSDNYCVPLILLYCVFVIV